MIDVNELRKGVTFELENNLYKVIEYKHHKPGRGKATIRTKVRNLRTGAITERTFNSGDRVQDVRLETRVVQYLYNDGDVYYFMDKETYEQPGLNVGALEDAIPYLKEGLDVKLVIYDTKPLDIELPTAVDLKVEEAEMAVKGAPKRVCRLRCLCLSTRAIQLEWIPAQVNICLVPERGRIQKEGWHR